MDKMARTLDLHWNITYVIRYITKTRGERIVETVEFFPEKFTLTFPSAQELATQAAADLTRALLHPQSAGLFCKVADEHTIALKRLANIFEGTTQRKSKMALSPSGEMENAAPPRVANTTTQKMSPQLNISSHLTQNSYHRQRTPDRRAVTPPAPHGMV
jgi:hypothetical protein